MTAHLLVTADIKTGDARLNDDDLPAYWLKYPTQLACYRDGVTYDTETDTRGEQLPTHPTVAFIYHYDLDAAINGEPVDWQIIPVNLDAGREGGDIAAAHAVWAARTDMFGPPIKETTPCDTESGHGTTTDGCPSVETTHHSVAAATNSSTSSETTSSSSSPTSLQSHSQTVTAITEAPNRANTSPSQSSATTEQEPDSCDTDCSPTGRAGTPTSAPTTETTTASPSSTSSETTNSSSSLEQSTNGTRGTTTTSTQSSSTSSATTAPDRRQALRNRWDQLNNAAKARFAELAPPPDDLDAVEAALDQVDAFATVAPPSPPHVDEIQPTTIAAPASPGVVAHIATAIGESPWRDLINTWVSEAHAAGVGWNPKAYPTIDNVARAATALDMARAAKGDGETVRALLLSQHDQALDLPIGAVLGALTVAQCAAVRELAAAI